MSIVIPTVAQLIKTQRTGALPRIIAAGRVDLTNYDAEELQVLVDNGVQIPGLADALNAEHPSPLADAPAEEPVATNPKRNGGPAQLAAAAKELQGVIPLPEAMATSVCEKYNVWPFDVVEHLGLQMDKSAKVFRFKGFRAAEEKYLDTLVAAGFSQVQIHRMTPDSMKSIALEAVEAGDVCISPDGAYTVSPSAEEVADVPVIVAPAPPTVTPRLTPHERAAALFNDDIDIWKSTIRKAGISGRVTSGFITQALSAGDLPYRLEDGRLSLILPETPETLTKEDALDGIMNAPKGTVAEIISDQFGLGALPEDVTIATPRVLEAKALFHLRLGTYEDLSPIIIDGRLAQFLAYGKTIGLDIAVLAG